MNVFFVIGILFLINTLNLSKCYPKNKSTGTSNVCIEKLKLLSDFVSIFQFPNYNIFSIEIATDLSDRACR